MGHCCFIRTRWGDSCIVDSSSVRQRHTCERQTACESASTENKRAWGANASLTGLWVSPNFFSSLFSSSVVFRRDMITQNDKAWWVLDKEKIAPPRIVSHLNLMCTGPRFVHDTGGFFCPSIGMLIGVAFTLSKEAVGVIIHAQKRIFSRG